MREPRPDEAIFFETKAKRITIRSAMANAGRRPTRAFDRSHSSFMVPWTCSPRVVSTVTFWST